MSRLALALAGALLAAWPAGAEPPVWVVRDADSELVLFGSIHVLPKDLEWRPAALDQALSGAEDLWFELPLDARAQGEIAELAARRGALPAGQSLFALLEPDDADALRKMAQAYDVQAALLDRLQPWMAEVVLTTTMLARQGAVADEGVERVLADAAPGAARRALETPAEQIEFLAGAPLGQQIAALNQAVAEMAVGPDAFARVLDAWRRGDLPMLEAEALAPLKAASPELFERLVAARNRRWTQTLAERMKGRGRTVVVVGMGHLLGPGGVPARLKTLGYEVQGP